MLSNEAQSGCLVPAHGRRQLTGLNVRQVVDRPRSCCSDGCRCSIKQDRSYHQRSLKPAAQVRSEHLTKLGHRLPCDSCDSAPSTRCSLVRLWCQQNICSMQKVKLLVEGGSDFGAMIESRHSNLSLSNAESPAASADHPFSSVHRQRSLHSRLQQSKEQVHTTRWPC